MVWELLKDDKPNSATKYLLGGLATLLGSLGALGLWYAQLSVDQETIVLAKIRKAQSIVMSEGARLLGADQTLGKLLLEEEEWKNAKEVFDRILAKDPFNAGALAGRGQAHLGSEQAELAMEDLNASLRINPNSTFALVRRGDAFLNLKSYQNALNSYELALKQAPDDIDAKIGMIIARFKLEIDDDSTIKELLNLRQRTPKFEPEITFQLGVQYERKKDCGRAIEYFSKAIELKKGAGFYLWRAVCHEKLGNYGAAHNDYTSAINLKPTSPTYSAYRGSFHKSRGDSEKALLDYNEAIRLDSTNIRSRMGRAFVLTETNRHSEAMIDYDIALSHVTIDAYLYAMRGNANSRLKRHEKSIQDLTRATELDPIDARYLFWRGQSKINAGRTIEGERDVAQAIKMEPGVEKASTNRRVAFELP